MKATGIVRRIDDLGRVVIPKEIRRTLRIREGDPLEIYVERNGEIILKKYSPISELGDFAKDYAEALYEGTGHIVMVSDTNAIINVFGISKSDYIDKEIGSLIEDSMHDRKTFFEENGGKFEIVSGLIESYGSTVIAPIIVNGDAIGSVIIIAKDKTYKMTIFERKMAETAALFLGKQMA